MSRRGREPGGPAPSCAAIGGAGPPRFRLREINMATARIYVPERSHKQAGAPNNREWLLEFMPSEPKRIEPLMGWTTSGDMLQQVHLRFPTKEDAIAYAQAHGIPYRVEEPKPSFRKVFSYSDNFRSTRPMPWTH